YRVGYRIGFTKEGKGRAGTRMAILLASTKLREVANKYLSSAKDIEDCCDETRFVPSEDRLGVLYNLRRHLFALRARTHDPIDREEIIELRKRIDADINALKPSQMGENAPEMSAATAEPLEFSVASTSDESEEASTQEGDEEVLH